MAQNLNIYNKYLAAGSSSNQIYQDCLMAGSSSQDATETAYPTNTNPTNNGYTYLSSNPTTSAVRFARTRTEVSDAEAFMTKYPTSGDLHTRGQVNYWITGSMIIAAGVASFVTSSYGLGPANTSAKVSIPVENFIGKNTRTPNEANDVKGFSILSYNGVISTIGGYNDFSSSTFNNVSQSYVVLHVSASKANMGTLVTSPLYMALGTTQNSSATRNGNDSTTNVSGHAAFEARYPSGSANRNGRR